MYGRGVTDDKGPILATLHAMRELLAEGDMAVNVVFAYEGEEENASGGFRDAISRLADDSALREKWLQSQSLGAPTGRLATAPRAAWPGGPLAYLRCSPRGPQKST